MDVFGFDMSEELCFKLRNSHQGGSLSYSCMRANCRNRHHRAVDPSTLWYEELGAARPEEIFTLYISIDHSKYTGKGFPCYGFRSQPKLSFRTAHNSRHVFYTKYSFAIYGSDNCRYFYRINEPWEELDSPFAVKKYTKADMPVLRNGRSPLIRCGIGKSLTIYLTLDVIAMPIKDRLHTSHYFSHESNQNPFFPRGPFTRLCRIAKSLARTNTLSRNLGNNCLRHAFTDFTIECNDTSFACHKFVLSSRSMVFAALFKANMHESQRNKTVINNVSVESVSVFLNIIYSEEIPENCTDVILETLSLLQRYFVQPDTQHVDLLFRLVAAGMSLKNVCSVAEEALAWNFVYLKTRVTDFLFAKREHIVKDPLLMNRLPRECLRDLFKLLMTMNIPSWKAV